MQYRNHYAGSRPSYGRRPSPSRRPARAPQRGQNIHHSKFINKGQITTAEERFVPTHAFADFAIDARIKANIARKGYVTPTPIQDQAIPHILEGRDIVGIANTGTGKTGAFLIPLLDKVVKNRDERILIMVPTRELAVQIEEGAVLRPRKRLVALCGRAQWRPAWRRSVQRARTRLRRAVRAPHSRCM